MIDPNTNLEAEKENILYSQVTYTELSQEIQLLVQKEIAFEETVKCTFSPEEVNTIESLFSYHMNIINGYSQWNDEGIYALDLAKDPNGHLLKTAHQFVSISKCFTIAQQLNQQISVMSEDVKLLTTKAFLQLVREHSLGKTYQWPHIIRDFNPTITPILTSKQQQEAMLIDVLFQKYRSHHKRERPCICVQRSW